MSREYKAPRITTPLNAVGLSIICNNGIPTDRSSLLRDVREHADGQESGLGPGVVESHYSGYEPNLVPTCHDVYFMKQSVRAMEEQKYPRIPCRNVLACIKTDQGASVIVNLINISRGGACFSGYVEFDEGTHVSIATHYMEGGQNIFQDGRIVRVQYRPSIALPGEYAVEFSRSSSMAHNASAITSDGAVGDLMF
jgi:hypothetical protein